MKIDAKYVRAGDTVRYVRADVDVLFDVKLVEVEIDHDDVWIWQAGESLPLWMDPLDTIELVSELSDEELTMRMLAE